jgi:hypothetical protein
MNNFWTGIAAAQHAIRRSKAADRGPHVLSILAGVLLALLIGSGLFVIAALNP